MPAPAAPLALKNLRIAGWLLILWFLCNAALAVSGNWQDVAALWLDMPGFPPRGILRIFFLGLLPLASMAGLLFRTEWARSACLLSLGAAVFFEGAIVHFVLGIYREQQGVMGEDAREIILPRLLFASTLVLIHIAFFIAVWGRMIFRTSREDVLAPAAQEAAR